jgi:hypothetical protein
MPDGEQGSSPVPRQDASLPPVEADAASGEPSTPDAGRPRPPPPDALTEPPADGRPFDARPIPMDTSVAAAADAASYNTPVVCTSGDHWTGGDRGAGNMYPGRPCVACHTTKRGPPFTLAGTIFPTAHEPDDCNGADGFFTGAAITITDANGMTHTTLANLAGNFYFPAAEKIVAGGRERMMVLPQMNPDCNACHTVKGDMMAPGRIMLP